jgi:hypothetical protein
MRFACVFLKSWELSVENTRKMPECIADVHLASSRSRVCNLIGTSEIKQSDSKTVQTADARFSEFWAWHAAAHYIWRDVRGTFVEASSQTRLGKGSSIAQNDDSLKH